MVTVLQHVAHEGPGRIGHWLNARGIGFRVVRLWEGDPVPGDPGEGLVVMGGPMNVGDSAAFSWMEPEQALVARSLVAGRRVLGVCLGSQLMAAALGAAVYPASEGELGWWPVEPCHPDAASWGVGGGVEVLHWHLQTFDLPVGAERLASTGVALNQAFRFGGRAYGLQFHLEVDEAMLRDWYRLTDVASWPGSRIQDADAGLASLEQRIPAAHAALDRILANWWAG